MKPTRPKNVPKVLQRKSVPQVPASRTTRVAAPPIYRPQATPRCLQLKRAGGGQPARPVGPTAPKPGGQVLQLMQVTKSLPQSDEVKAEITGERNGPFERLPPEAMLNIFAHLDRASGARLAKTQKALHNFRKQKFSATTDWGVFWITEHSYYQGITYEKGKRMGQLPNAPAFHLQKKIGVSIKIEFVAGPHVRASKIGLIQTVQHYVNGKSYPIDPFKKDMWVDAEEGYKAHIDVLKEAVDPMYAADIKDKKRGMVGSGPADPYHGQWGTPQQTATLIDEPQDRTVLGSRDSTKNVPNSGQVFETTALALQGEHEGQYYGSVKWGWRTDAEGTFQILPLTVISMGSASKTFAQAADAWNKGNNTTCLSNRKLPIPKQRD